MTLEVEVIDDDMEAQSRISVPCIVMFYDNVIKQLDVDKKSPTERHLECLRAQLPIITMTRDGQEFLRWVRGWIGGRQGVDGGGQEDGPKGIDRRIRTGGWTGDGQESG